MARESRSDLAVLAALSVQPMTGYAIREAIRDELGHFWSESFGQIYPAIAGLAQAKLISKAAGSTPKATTWQLTEAGRERLLELLRRPDTPAPPRNGLMLRLFFGNILGPEECAQLIRKTREDAIAALATFDGIRDGGGEEPRYGEFRPYWDLTISAGEHSARATIAWADEALEALSSFPRDGTPDRG